MPRALTAQESQEFRAVRQVGVMSVASDDGRPPLTVPIWSRSTARRPPSRCFPIARRYLPEEHAQAFVSGELGRSDSELTLYTIRPDRWLSTDFG